MCDDRWRALHSEGVWEMLQGGEDGTGGPETIKQFCTIVMTRAFGLSLGCCQRDLMLSVFLRSCKLLVWPMSCYSFHCPINS
jgi:hypothetical protein